MARYNAPLSAAVAASSSGDNAIVAAQGAGKKIKVFNYTLIATTAVTVKWRSGTTDKTGPMPYGATGGAAPSSGDTETPLFETAANEALNLNLSSAVAVGGHVAYRVEA